MAITASTFLLTTCVMLYLAACTTIAPVKEELPALDARFRSAYARNAGIEAAIALTEIARRWPGQLAIYSDGPIGYTASAMLGSSATEKAVNLELLWQLHAQHWKDRLGMEPSGMWGQLVGLLVERGRVSDARGVMADIRAAQPLVVLRVDRRFRALMQGGAPALSVESAARLEIEDCRRAMVSLPRSLYATTCFLQAALRGGEYTESLAAADLVLAKLAAARTPRDVYDDANEYLTWVHTHRAWSLGALGEWPLAEADLRAAADLDERGSRSVSNAINLASYYAEQEQPDAAVAALGSLGESDPRLSKYGVMELKLVRYEIAVLKNDAAATRESFEYISEHGTDAWGVFQSALLVADRQDEGARLLIERLRDPERRAAALVAVQIFLDKPHLPLAAVVHQRWQELVDRPDVKVAISEVGVVERFGIPEP